MVESYIETGAPVGSRTLAELGQVEGRASTIRAELAWLEQMGLLDHPHTSAGRVPTEGGFRLYAGRLAADRSVAPRSPLVLDVLQGEIDEALRATTDALAQVANVLAVASAPSVSTVTIRHVEVLQLQASLVMVVVISADGTVAKRIFALDGHVDGGICDWARAYLNETLTGHAIGTRVLRRHLDAPDLGAREREFLHLIAPVFTEVMGNRGERLFVGGASRLVSALQQERVDDLAQLAAALEQRATLLALLQEALGPGRVVVRLGEDHLEPVLRQLAFVASTYGVGGRQLGVVGVVGPLRMDYAAAISSVRGAASALSDFAETVYG